MKNKISQIVQRLKTFICLSFFSLTIFNIQPAKADFNNLKLCKDSPAFQKRLNSSVKKLENRLKLYTPESKEAGFINKEIEQTKARFERYGNANLLCGKEGLPRIIATGQFDRANEFVIPGIMFLYITGWIGWAGRSYLQFAKKTDKPNENEIIINVPVAIGMMSASFLWPFAAWKELV